MGIFSIFKKKEKPPAVDIKSLPPISELSLEKTSAENMKAKMDLIATQMDSLRTQYETLNERIKNIEKLVTEIRSFYK